MISNSIIKQHSILEPDNILKDKFRVQQQIKIIVSIQTLFLFGGHFPNLLEIFGDHFPIIELIALSQKYNLIEFNEILSDRWWKNVVIPSFRTYPES